MKQQPIFSRSSSLVLLVLAALSAPAMAQGSYSDTPADAGEQQYGRPEMERQAPMGREQEPGFDSRSRTESMEGQSADESRSRGPMGPIREDERWSGGTAAQRGFEGFRDFQQERTNTP